MKKLRLIETLAWTVGLTLMAIWAGFWLHSRLGSQADLERFERAKALQRAEAHDQQPTGGHSRPDPRESESEAPAAATAIATPAAAATLSSEAEVDFSLWAEGRILGYEESLAEDLGAPMAILRIPKLELEVAVHEGTSELVLNRGVGRIEGTAGIDDRGNLGLAGHRDGFFRGLKDVEPGDIMELETLTSSRRYVIDKISIVQPEDVWVLEPSAEARITLVTCYPFYFVGKAPLRYIVHSHELVPGDSQSREVTRSTS